MAICSVRRWFLVLIAFLVGNGVLGAPALAEDFPSRQIEIIVGAGPGGGTDVFTRTISLDARRSLGQPIVVYNMPAAAGAAAVEEVMNRPADGYTLISFNPVQVITYVLGRIPYSPVEHFQPLIRAQKDVMFVVVSTNGPFATIHDLITYAKENPGRLTIGGTASAGFDEVMAAVFAREAGVEAVYVPFDSGAEMQAALVGGHIHAILDEPAATVSLVEAGQVKMILAFSEERISAFPDVPATVADLGWDPIRSTLSVWRGLAVKQGTPKERIDVLHAAFYEAMQGQAYKALEEASYLHLSPGHLGPDEFTELVRNEVEVYTEILRDLGYLD